MPIDLALDALDGDLVGKKVAILGLAFKPNSDDVRDSPALDVAIQLHGRGVHVVATDPHAIENAKRLQPQLDYVDTVDEALSGADAVVLVTEWDEYRSLDPAAAAKLVRRAVVVDGRNVFDSAAWWVGILRPWATVAELPFRLNAA